MLDGVQVPTGSIADLLRTARRLDFRLHPRTENGELRTRFHASLPLAPPAVYASRDLAGRFPGISAYSPGSRRSDPTDAWRRSSGCRSASCPSHLWPRRAAGEAIPKLLERGFARRPRAIAAPESERYAFAGPALPVHPSAHASRSTGRYCPLNSGGSAVGAP